MFQHLLVPLDGSLRAERALPLAARLARASGGTVTLLRVVTSPAPVNTFAPTGYTASVRIMEREIEEAVHYLRQLSSSHRALRDVEVVTEVYTGAPAHFILHYAQMHDIDLLVLCSHGETGFKRWMLGSVALQVARHSTMPVLVLNARSEAASELPSGEQPFSALVALDGSSLAESALVPAAHLCASLAAPNQGRLHLTMIVPQLHLVRDEEAVMTHMHAEDMNAARLYLSRVERRLQEGKLAQLYLAVSSSVISGNDVADSLIRVAERGECIGSLEGFRGCDVIALATHGRSGLARWVMGSITERVLGTTTLPLLIVRPRLVESEEKATR